MLWCSLHVCGRIKISSDYWGKWERMNGECDVVCVCECAVRVLARKSIEIIQKQIFTWTMFVRLYVCECVFSVGFSICAFSMQTIPIKRRANENEIELVSSLVSVSNSKHWVSTCAAQSSSTSTNRLQTLYYTFCIVVRVCGNIRIIQNNEVAIVSGS